MMLDIIDLNYPYDNGSVFFLIVHPGCEINIRELQQLSDFSGICLSNISLGHGPSGIEIRMKGKE